MGVMLQRGGVYPMLGPRRVLDLFSSYYRHPLATEPLLDLVALRPVATTPWRHLSGGEQQRLSLALALIGRPQVAFLDEPTAGVDPEGRGSVRSVIRALRARGACVVLATHELAEAEELADRVVIVREGKVLADGPPHALAAGGPGTMRFATSPPIDAGALSAAVATHVAEERPGHYRVDAPLPSVAALTSWLSSQGAELTELRTSRSLEESYLALVGEPEGTTPEPDAATPARRRRPR
jgi:ABC-2 type transport system ATP-binding protein